MRIVPMLLLLSSHLGVCNAQTTAGSVDEAVTTGGKTTLVKRADISTVIDFEGYFEPTESYEVRVRPKSYQGELSIVTVAVPGTAVKKGDSLIQLDSTQIKKQLAAAENEQATADANLAKAQADVQLGEAGDALALKMQQTELSNSEEGLKWWEQVDGAQMLKSAELAVKTSKDNVEDNTDELEQLKKIYKSEELTNATADIVVKRAIRGLERSRIVQGMQEAKETKVRQFDYTVARQKLVFAIEQQRQQLAELLAKQQQQGTIRKTSLTSAQAAADKAEQKVNELKEDVAAFDVEAPFDGVAFAGEFVQGRWKDANPKALRAEEKVGPGPTILTVVPQGKLRLVLEVPESKLGFLKADSKMRVIANGFPDAACEGTLISVPMVPVTRERDQFFPTSVALSRIDPRLAPAQRATARIDVNLEDVLVVPASAVSNGRVKVRGADDKTTWRNVVTGVSDGDVVEIREGLKEGEEVLTKAAK